MAKSDYLTQDLKPIIDKIDWDKVYNELVLSQGAKPTEELWRETTNLLLLALEMWIRRDLQEFENVTVEQKYKNGKVIIDLEATCKGTLAPFERYKGEKVLLDWKTTFDIVDSEKWRNKCLGSWQWKTYAAERNSAKIFIYRGISRSLWEPKTSGGVVTEYSRTKEILIEIPPDIDKSVKLQYTGVTAQLNALKNFPIWPTNPSPDTCWAWSTPCPELSDCTNYSMLEHPLTYEEELSYSSMSRFMMCPERFRKQALRKLSIIETDPDSSDFTVVGTMFHAGIAEIYRQLWN